VHAFRKAAAARPALPRLGFADTGKNARVYARGGSGLFTIVWIVVGVLLARSHHYFVLLNTVRQIVSAALAIVLWPLLLLGISLHIHP
jgi:hypothetical protein